MMPRYHLVGVNLSNHCCVGSFTHCWRGLPEKEQSLLKLIPRIQ